MKLLHSLIIFIYLVSSSAYGSVFPGTEWDDREPSKLGIDSQKIEQLFEIAFADDSTQGVVLIKDGYLIAEKYADNFDQNSLATSWSMAKSFYAALIGISIDKGEIESLDDPVSKYLKYFNDDRSKITIRDLLIMSSGLEFPEHEHEMMFFQSDHLDYAKQVGVEKRAGQQFEYNNVNSMLLGDILYAATGEKADTLLSSRVLDPIGVTTKTLWRDEAENVLTYCCIDMSPRDYARFGLLFSRNGAWNNNQLISKEYVDASLSTDWDFKSLGLAPRGGYGLHWWMSKDDQDGTIYQASGKFGQYIFVDRANDVVAVKVTKYEPTGGNVQRWRQFKWIQEINDMEIIIPILNFLDQEELITLDIDHVTTPITKEEGEQELFQENFFEFVDQLATLGQ